jgi:hypothetical protein
MEILGSAVIGERSIPLRDASMHLRKIAREFVKTNRCTKDITQAIDRDVLRCIVLCALERRESKEVVLRHMRNQKRAGFGGPYQETEFRAMKIRYLTSCGRAKSARKDFCNLTALVLADRSLSMDIFQITSLLEMSKDLLEITHADAALKR